MLCCSGVTTYFLSCSVAVSCDVIQLYFLSYSVPVVLLNSISCHALLQWLLNYISCHALFQWCYSILFPIILCRSGVTQFYFLPCSVAVVLLCYSQATEDLPHTVDSSHLDDSQAIVTSKAADAPVTSSAAPAPTATVTTLTDATTNGEDEDVGTPLCRDRRPADTAGDTSGPEGLARWRGRAERCGDIAALIEVSERFAGVCGERGARRARDAAGRLRAVQETGKGRSIVVKMMTRVYDCGWRQREQGGATEGGRGGGKTGKSPRMPAVNTLRAGDKGSLTKVQIKKSKKNKLKDANRNDMKTRVVKPGDSDSGGAGQERKVKKSLKRKRAQTVEAGDHGVKLYDERVLKSVKLQTAIKTKRTKKKNLQMDLSN